MAPPAWTPTCGRHRGPEARGRRAAFSLGRLRSGNVPSVQGNAGTRDHAASQGRAVRGAERRACRPEVGVPSRTRHLRSGTPRRGVSQFFRVRLRRAPRVGVALGVSLRSRSAVSRFRRVPQSALMFRYARHYSMAYGAILFPSGAPRTPSFPSFLCCSAAAGRSPHP